MIDSLESWIYLYHLDKFYNIPVTPENLPNSYANKFSLEDIMNRTAPKFAYSGSGPRTLTVNLVIHKQLFALDNENSSGTVDELIKALEACAYPEYDKAKSKIIPPSVLLKFGNVVTIRGVINTGINCTHSGPWLKDGTMALANIQFSIVELDQYGANFISQFGSNVPIPTDLERTRLGG